MPNMSQTQITQIQKLCIVLFQSQTVTHLHSSLQVLKSKDKYVFGQSRPTEKKKNQTSSLNKQ